MNGEKFVRIVGSAMELTGCLALTSIALVSEYRRHKAQRKLIDKENELAFSELDRTIKQIKIDHLEKELSELRSKKES